MSQPFVENREAANSGDLIRSGLGLDNNELDEFKRKKQKVKFSFIDVREIDRVSDDSKPYFWVNQDDFRRMETDVKMTFIHWENHLEGKLLFDESNYTLRGLERQNGERTWISQKHIKMVLGEINRQKFSGVKYIDWENVRQVSAWSSTCERGRGQDLGRKDEKERIRIWMGTQMHGSSSISMALDDESISDINMKCFGSPGRSLSPETKKSAFRVRKPYEGREGVPVLNESKPAFSESCGKLTPSFVRKDNASNSDALIDPNFDFDINNDNEIDELELMASKLDDPSTLDKNSDVCKPGKRRELCVKRPKDPKAGIPSALVLQNDVLFGKGKFRYSHPGTKRFRQIILKYRGHYQSAKLRAEKGRIIATIIGQVKTCGGRFLRCGNSNCTDGMWYLVDENLAHKKVSDALRGAKPALPRPMPSANSPQMFGATLAKIGIDDDTPAMMIQTKHSWEMKSNKP